MNDVSPLRFYADDDMRLPARLRQSLEAQYRQRSEPVLTGVCKSFDDYRHRVGELQGLKLAMDICDGFTKEMTGN